MLIEQTLDKLNAMKLGAMADAWRQQIQTDEAAALSFDERLGLLVDAEWTAREQRKLERRLRTAKLRYPATLEAVDFTHPRRLNRQQILTLGACAWVTERHNLIVTGPTGIGKSFLSCAFVERACRRGFTARYVRMPRLLHELAVGRGDGSYTRLLARLAKLDLLASPLAFERLHAAGPVDVERPVEALQAPTNPIEPGSPAPTRVVASLLLEPHRNGMDAPPSG